MIFEEKVPEREILRSPFSNAPSPSFGILAYAMDTGRWLLVQRKYSPDFLILLRGMYVKTMLKEIISNLSFEERAILFDVLTGKRPLEKLFIGTVENREYSQERLNTHREFILKILASLSKIWTQTEWLWPKGKMESKAESRIESARREFEEEAGVKLDTAIYTGIGPLVDRHRGSDGKFYETRTWVYIFTKEIRPKKPEGLEISRRQWVKPDEALKLLRPSKREVFKEAMKGVRERISGHQVENQQ